MWKGLKCGTLTALSLALLLPIAQAYESTLAPAALHDAYVLGQRNDQTTAEFLDPYVKQTTGAVDGGTPHLSQIEVLTPFAQVVDESRRKGTAGFSEQQALADYHKRGDTLVIRVNLVLPAAYPEKERGAQAPSVSHDQKQTDALPSRELLAEIPVRPQAERQDHPHEIDSQSTRLLGRNQEFALDSRRPDGLARVRRQERRKRIDLD